MLQSIPCRLGRHAFSEWQESHMNKYHWAHEKIASRFCLKCGKGETAIITVDCTQFRRSGKWCSRCEDIVKNTGMVYILPVTKDYSNMPATTKPVSRGILGQPANVDRILQVKELFSQGKKYREIVEITGITSLKTIFKYKKYPLERLQLQIEARAKTAV